MKRTDPGELLAACDVCICAGSGGVGKTTTSAALATEMALRGRKVAVLTIDPAKRLADSLGLDTLGNEPRRVDPALFEQAGLEPEPGGELWAMMLDAKATFDQVVERHAPDEEARDRILGNNIYRQISNALAGSQEYMAMEKLYELAETGDYDLLVLDTPPSPNALDFLDAPRRLMQFIEGRSMQLFIKPTGLGARIFGRGSSVVASILKRLTGLDLIEDLSEFFTAMGGMVSGFRERAARVDQLLAADSTSFLIISGPSPGPSAEARYFHSKLTEEDLPFGGLIINRVRRPGGWEPEARSALPDLLGDADLAARVEAACDEHEVLARRDHETIAKLADQTGTEPVVVPELPGEIHDLAGLAAVSTHLFGT